MCKGVFADPETIVKKFSALIHCFKHLQIHHQIVVNNNIHKKKQKQNNRKQASSGQTSTYQHRVHDQWCRNEFRRDFFGRA